MTLIADHRHTHSPQSNACRPWLIKVLEHVRAGVCRPCVEKELTATKKSATDSNWSVTTLCRHKRAYDRIQLVADSCWQSRMFNFYDQLPINEN